MGAQHSITTLLVVLLVGATASPAAGAGTARPALPNIVFVLADDMSYDSVSHLNPAIGNMKTPHIDRLAREGEDSFSLLPLVTGEVERLDDHPMVVHHSYSGQFSIRDGRWKLILPQNAGGKSVLYDLDTDVKETTNVAARHPERVKTLTAALKAYVTNGRSTPGAKQPNHNGQTAWKGLPW